jgi:hypothetical protein
MRKLMGASLLTVTLATAIREPVLSTIEGRKTIAYPGQRKKLAAFFGVDEAELFDSNGFAREATNE